MSYGARFLPFAEAIALISASGISGARSKLSKLLREGRLSARAEYVYRISETHDGPWLERTEDWVPVTFWRDLAWTKDHRKQGGPNNNPADEDFSETWHLGEFFLSGITDDWELIHRRVSDATVWEPDLRAALANPTSDLAAAKAGDDAAGGGRPASKHGHAIAAATLRLSALSPSEFARYTVEALATELEEDYQRCGERPPSPRSRELFAAGILAVLRNRGV